jgi:hypothetical protein
MVFELMTDAEPASSLREAQYHVNVKLNSQVIALTPFPVRRSLPA